MEVPSRYADADRELVPGDYDASGATNGADLAVFARLFGLPITAGVSADGDANGVVDGSDFLLWQRNFGATAAPVIATAEGASEPAVVAAVQAAEEETAPLTLMLRNSDLIDLAFAAEEHWRTELIDDDRASIESFASVEQTVPIEAGAMSLHVGWGNAPPARRMTLRFRRDDVPAYVADDNAPLRVDYFFRGLPSASES